MPEKQPRITIYTAPVQVEISPESGVPHIIRCIFEIDSSYTGLRTIRDLQLTEEGKSIPRVELRSPRGFLTLLPPLNLLTDSTASNIAKQIYKFFPNSKARSEIAPILLGQMIGGSDRNCCEICPERIRRACVGKLRHRI